MDFKTITNIEEAKSLWNELSLHNTIDDEWDFRYTFFKHLTYVPHFLTGFSDGKAVGVLPLQKNTGVGLMPPYATSHKPFLEFFGGDDTDDNAIMVKPGYEGHIPEFLEKIREDVILAPLKNPYEELGLKTQEYTNKYFIDLKGLTTYEDFIDRTWSGDSRGKFKRGLKKLYREHTIEMEYGNLEDLDLMAELNLQRFGESSSFRFPYRASILKDLSNIFPSEVITVKVDGKKEAVSFGLYYKDTYIAINLGVNSKINNLGKHLIMHQIDKAIEHKCLKFDAGKGDFGWKEQYKLKKIPQYQLSLHG